MNQEIEYRDFRIVQMSAIDMAPLLGCSPMTSRTSAPTPGSKSAERATVATNDALR